LRKNQKYVTPHKTGCKTVCNTTGGCKKKEELSYFGRHFRETGFERSRRESTELTEMNLIQTLALIWTCAIKRRETVSLEGGGFYVEVNVCTAGRSEGRILL